ncbi:MAG: peptidoglycan-binding protein [Candidatus Paceibacterota bacterium]|jgi:hypothetical protein
MKKLKVFLFVLVVVLGGFSSAFAVTTPAPVVTILLQDQHYKLGSGNYIPSEWLSTLSVPQDQDPGRIMIKGSATNATSCTFVGNDWSEINSSYVNKVISNFPGEEFLAMMVSKFGVANGGMSKIGTYTFSVTCTGPGGTGTDRVTLNIVPPNPNFPSAKLTASKYAVKDGESVTLSWTSANANSCSGSGRWTIAGGPPYNSGGPSGIQIVGPLSSSDSPFDFGIDCWGSDGQGNTLVSPRSIILVTATSDAPVITSIDTSTPSIGDTVIVKGSNFDSNTMVIFDNGDTRATPTIISSTSLSFVVPSHTGSGFSYAFNVGTHKLQLNNNGSLSNSISFEVVPVLQNTHLTIVEPGGYRTWKIGSTQIFKWKTERVPATATGYISFASAGYGGEAVINKKIADNIPNTGSFTWTSVGRAADGSSIPASIYPYGFTVVMNVPDIGQKVSDYKDRTIILSETAGEVSPTPTPTPAPIPLPAQCLGGPGATNNCPVTTGQFCGGIAGIQCTTGYSCKLDGSYPDAGGTCIKNVSPNPVLGCSGGNIFNTQTGLPCVNNVGNDNQPSGTPRSYNFGDKTLRSGSRGDAVVELQRFLNDKLNLGLVLDGKLGPKTIAVIKMWQADHGLVADGLIGRMTKAQMLAEVN